MNDTANTIECNINTRLLENIDAVRLAAQVQDAVASFLKDLSLDGSFAVRISPATPGQLAALQVGGVPCFYPAQLPQQVYHAVTGSYLPSLWEDDGLLAKLDELPGDHLVLYFKTLFEEMIYVRPQVLVTQDVIRFALQKNGHTEAGEIFIAVKKVVEDLVAQFVPVRSMNALITELQKHAGNDLQAEISLEELLVEWKSPVIELCIPEPYFRSLTLHAITRERPGWESQWEDQALFEVMKEGLFLENGVIYPPIKISFFDGLPVDSFQVRINSWRSLPVKGLKAGEMLAAVVPAVGGQTLFSVANCTTYSILPEGELQNVAGIQMKWSPMGYVILVMSQLLRARAHWFVHKQFTAGSLNKLSQLNPRLVEAAGAAEKNHLVTRVLRLLAAEEIPVRDLANILQQIIEADVIDADEFDEIIFDNRLAMHEADATKVLSDADYVCTYVRHNLRNYITGKYTRNTNNLNVILFDREIEERLKEDSLGPVETARIFRDLREKEPVGAVPLPILTTSNLRPCIRNLIAGAFPLVPVLSYRELSVYTAVTVSGKIALK